MKSSKKELTLLLLALLTTITTVAVTFATISPDKSSIIGIQSVFAQDDDQGEDDDDQGEDEDDQGEDVEVDVALPNIDARETTT